MIKEDIKIGENEKCIFYKNMFTKDFDNGYKIVVCEFKDSGNKEYLLIKNNKPLYSHTNIENIYYRYDAYKRIDLEKEK